MANKKFLEADRWSAAARRTAGILSKPTLLVLLVFAVTSVTLVLGCTPATGNDDVDSGQVPKGRVTITIGTVDTAASQSISPSYTIIPGSPNYTIIPDGFQNTLYYTLEFTAEGKATVTGSIDASVGVTSVTVEMDIGTWTLNVKGYPSEADAGQPDKVAATGSSTVNVTTDTQPITVPVKGVTDGTGLLDYKVNFPDGLTIATLTIKLPNGTTHHGRSLMRS
jgi:hypothetical protein